MIQQNVAAESSGFSFSCSTRSRAHSCHWQLISKTTSPWEQGPTINCWSRSGLWWWYLHWDPRWDSTGLHWGHPLGSFHSLCMWRPFFHLCFLSSEESWDLLPLSWHCCLPPPVWSLCAPQLLSCFSLHTPRPWVFLCTSDVQNTPQLPTALVLLLYTASPIPKSINTAVLWDQVLCLNMIPVSHM